MPSSAAAALGRSHTVVHRCTFVPWRPHAINAIAHSERYVAVARADGDVELWNCFDARWFLEAVITGREDRPVRCLAWAGGPSVGGAGGGGRLFGASLAGEIFEFDVARLEVCDTCESYGGAVWAMQPSPADPSLLAAACEDGRVRIFKTGTPAQGASSTTSTTSTTSSNGRGAINLGYGRAAAAAAAAVAAGLGREGDGLRFLRGCEGTKNGERLLSVCWHRDGEVLFCGGADSQIRCIAAHSGRTLFVMTVENYGQEPTLVWALQVLSDFTVVSGDSLGHVQVSE
jgi:U3 small nucleolar RNA-associated protein 4